MKVLIDDVLYVPVVQNAAVGKSMVDALELRFDSDAGDNRTVREYLYELLALLWREQEGFSGKRPFGNSGWEYELLDALGRAGFVDCDVQEDEVFFDDGEKAAAMRYVEGLIVACFFGAPQEVQS